MIGVRSCYDEGKRVAETLMFDYHRQHGIGKLHFLRLSLQLSPCNLHQHILIVLYSLNCFCFFFVEIRIARIFNTYGPRMNIDDGRVVSNFIAQALR